MAIHPTAVIDQRAELDPSVEVGPYVVIDGPVQVATGTRIYPHAYLTGWTQIGRDCQIHPFTVIGHLPQDTKFKPEVRSYCRIGDGTVLREGVSVHRGTEPESATVIGKNCFVMANVHVGHNGTVGDGVTLINAVLLGGHVTIGDRAVLGGNSVAHQYCRVGEFAMLAGMAVATQDVPAFFMLADRNQCVGVNRVGVRRGGFAGEEVRELTHAYRVLYRGPVGFRAAISELAATLKTPAGRRLVEFLQAPSQRGIVGRPIRRRQPGDAPSDLAPGSSAATWSSTTS